MTVSFTKTPTAVYAETNPDPSEVTLVWTEAVAAIDDKLGSTALDSINRLTSGALVQTANILDPNDAGYTIGSFVRSNDGALQANAIYDASGFIPVSASTAYYVETMIHYAFYTSAQVYISGADTTTKTVTSPASAAFMRITIDNGATAPYVVAGSSPVSPRPEYGSTLNPARLTDLPTAGIADDAVTPAKLSFVTQTRNLFDKNAITADQFLSPGGSFSASDIYFVSDFIPVSPSTTYYCASGAQTMRFWTAYDADQVVVPSEGSSTAGNTIVVPASGVAYYRFTGHDDDLDLYQFEEGSSATAFEPYAFIADQNFRVPADQVTSKWLDKKWTSFGDSITNQNTWQPLVSGRLGLESTVLGVSGRRISGASGMCQDAAVDTIGTDAQVVTVFGGVNDWANSVALGTESSTDTNEFYGALNQMFSKLAARLQTGEDDCTIFAMTPVYAEFASGNWEIRSPVFQSASENNLGLTTRDYAEAIRVVAKKWGAPVIDISAEAGVHEFNVDAHRLDDGNHIHPDPSGDIRIARSVIGRMLSLEPLA